MQKYSLRNLQRLFRAKLSIFFNKQEYVNPKIKKIINEVYKLSENNIKLNKLNRKKTHKIFSKKVYQMIRKKKFLNFFQNSFIQQMFFVHNRFYLLSYLKELRNDKRWIFWKKLLLENNVGNPIRYFLYPKASGNKIFQTYHLKKYEEYCGIRIKNFSNVVEFGGGYGNMAVTFCRINSKVKFTIFDTFEVNLLQYYYLKRLNLNVKINDYKKKINNINLVNSIKILKKKEKPVQKKEKKLLIANWSISETPLSLRKKIFFLFKEFDYQLISFQSEFEKIDNISFFKKVMNYNIKQNRKVEILPIKKMKNHFYLFCKK